MILLASLGGALELHDFVVFGVFTSAIGAQPDDLHRMRGMCWTQIVGRFVRHPVREEFAGPLSHSGSIILTRKVVGIQNNAESGRIASAAAIIAVPVNTEGKREIVGLHIGPSEAETFGWVSLRA
jgi:Transposase, Mutator family